MQIKTNQAEQHKVQTIERHKMVIAANVGKEQINNIKQQIIQIPHVIEVELTDIIKIKE